MNKHGTNSRRCTTTNVNSLPTGINCLYWHGRSGRKYIHTIFSFSDWQGHCNANILLVRRNSENSREILWAGQTGEIAGLTSDRGALARARRAGANEIHIHLLGEDELMRQCIVEDLACEGVPSHVGILPSAVSGKKVPDLVSW